MAQGTAIDSSVPLNDAPVGDVIDPLEVEAAEPDAPDPAIEAYARTMGWKPLAEYRGPPGKWRPADEFIARGEEILPIVREQNRSLTARLGRFEGEITGLRSTIAEQTQIIKDLRDMGQRADQRGYDRALAEIRAKQGQAVESGDSKAWQQLREQEDALRESHAAAVTPATKVATDSGVTITAAPATPTAPVAVTDAVQGFIRSNPWFNADAVLNAAMIAHHNEVLRERNVAQASLNADPDLDRELLEEAKARVMERYPEKFGVARQPAAPAAPRRRAASVAAPTPEPPPQRSNSTMTINSIQDPAERAEAREAYNRMKRNMPDYSEAEYMALYTNPHSDVLALQQQARAKTNGR